ncbi:MAG: thymidylate kinase [Chloroflexi bacterium]|nr:thymidylate kinase [Chloroflexota bacterium]
MTCATDGSEPPRNPPRGRRHGPRAPAGAGVRAGDPLTGTAVLGRPAAASEALPGRLFVVEGIDGSGKSTQLDLLHKWLLSEGYLVVFSEWNSSPIVKATTRRGKKLRLLSPLSFSLIHAADFASRVYGQIVPALRAGAVVLADRYVYTAFARDAARGVSRAWLRRLYAFAVPPTLAFYFDVPLDEAVRRILAGRPALKYYEAGMDLNVSQDPVESFRRFQGLIREEYERLVDEFGMVRMDATETVVRQQQEMRRAVAPYLEGIRQVRSDGVGEALRQTGLRGRYLAAAGRRNEAQL